MSERIYIGVGTPQANPTVEIEFNRYLHAPVYPTFTRLVSTAADSEKRLVDYLEQLPQALRSFDTLPLCLFAFACTGSSYLVDDDRADQIIRETEQEYGIQIVTAVQAIRRELEGRGVRRIAMLMPYPTSLNDAAVSYWTRVGFDVVAVHRIDIGADTRAIYELDDDDVATALDAFDPGDADLLLLSGTGMPTMHALQRPGIPILSSNLCLATEVLRRVHAWPPNKAADPSLLLGES